MPILTFSPEWREKLIDGTKRQTIRHNVSWWLGKQTAAFMDPTPLYIWCPSPRSGRGVRLGTASRWGVAAIHGWEFSDQIAQKDGVGTVRELYGWLMETHEMTMHEVLEHEWAVIQWVELEVEKSIV